VNFLSENLRFPDMVMCFPQIPLPLAKCSSLEVMYPTGATLLKASGGIPGPHFGHAGARIGDTLLIWGGAI
jgi:hypothetical protein